MKNDFTTAILEALASGSAFKQDGGAAFQAVTESDLAAALRQQGWKLSAGFLSEVEEAGFTVRQGGQFAQPVRRAFKDGSVGRKLSEYQTIIFL